MSCFSFPAPLSSRVVKGQRGHSLPLNSLKGRNEYMFWRWWTKRKRLRSLAMRQEVSWVNEVMETSRSWGKCHCGAHGVGRGPTLFQCLAWLEAGVLTTEQLLLRALASPMAPPLILMGSHLRGKVLYLYRAWQLLTSLHTHKQWYACWSSLALSFEFDCSQVF